MIGNFAKKFQRQITFSVMAALFILMLAAFAVYASLFLLSKTNTDADDVAIPPTAPTDLKFDTAGFEKLNLVK